jgi:hypothetical protein
MDVERATANSLIPASIGIYFVVQLLIPYILLTLMKRRRITMNDFFSESELVGMMWFMVYTVNGSITLTGTLVTVYLIVSMITGKNNLWHRPFFTEAQFAPNIGQVDEEINSSTLTI